MKCDTNKVIVIVNKMGRVCIINSEESKGKYVFSGNTNDKQKSLVEWKSTLLFKMCRCCFSTR